MLAQAHYLNVSLSAAEAILIINVHRLRLFSFALTVLHSDLCRLSPMFVFALPEYPVLLLFTERMDVHLAKL